MSGVMSHRHENPFFSLPSSGPGCPIHSSEQFHLPAFLRSGHPLAQPLSVTASPPGELDWLPVYNLTRKLVGRSSFVYLARQDPATSRTLTLISKTIQTLGSLATSKSVSFSNRNGGRCFSNGSILTTLSDRFLSPMPLCVFLQGQFQRGLHGSILWVLQWAEVCRCGEECESFLYFFVCMFFFSNIQY